MSVECVRCGITPGDLPYEELGLTLDEAAETLFERVDGETRCQGCAQIGGEQHG